MIAREAALEEQQQAAGHCPWSVALVWTIRSGSEREFEPAAGCHHEQPGPAKPRRMTPEAPWNESKKGARASDGMAVACERKKWQRSEWGETDEV